jgi:hypothetical protein
MTSPQPDKPNFFSFNIVQVAALVLFVVAFFILR